MSREKRLCIFCRYAENGASSRLRYFRYRPFFEAAGIKPEYFSFFDSECLERLYPAAGELLPRRFPPDARYRPVRPGSGILHRV